MAMTFPIICACGCEAAVNAHDAGFSAVQCVVEPCERLKAEGVTSYTMRKSAAYEAAISADSAVRHRTGLVALGG